MIYDLIINILTNKSLNFFQIRELFLECHGFIFYKKNREQFNSTNIIYLEALIYVSQENIPRTIYLRMLLKENKKQLRFGATYLLRILYIKNPLQLISLP